MERGPSPTDGRASYAAGVGRDGISGETGLLASWPAAGPPLLWKISGLGEGFSALAVTQGHIFTQGQRNGREMIKLLAAKCTP